MKRKKGISHITFIVEDLNKSIGLFINLFNAKEVYDSSEQYHSISREKFLLVNDLWVAFMQGESLKEKTYNHIAFKIPDKDYDLYLSKIKKLGLEIIPDRKRLKGEGKSIYFYDYDNHLFELHTGILEDRIKGYNKYHSFRKTRNDQS